MAEECLRAAATAAEAYRNNEELVDKCVAFLADQEQSLGPVWSTNCYDEFWEIYTKMGGSDDDVLYLLENIEITFSRDIICIAGLAVCDGSIPRSAQAMEVMSGAQWRHVPTTIKVEQQFRVAATECMKMRGQQRYGLSPQYNQLKAELNNALRTHLGL